MFRLKQLFIFVSRSPRLRILLLIAMLILFLLLFLLCRSCTAQSDADEPEPLKLTEPVHIIEQFATRNNCYTTGRSLEVRGLMLHSVGSAQPSAAVYAKNFNTAKPNGREVCPHAFLQADGTVYQVLPWDMYGWHAGGPLNRTHIGIEMCEPASLVYTGPCTFYAEDPIAAKAEAENTYRTAVTLFAALCIRYDLDPLEDGVILSHTEGALLGKASNHSDPEHLWSGLDFPYTMDTFRADVHTRIAEIQ